MNLSGGTVAPLVPFRDSATKEGSLPKRPLRYRRSLSAGIRGMGWSIWKLIIGVVKVPGEKQVFDAAATTTLVVALIMLRRLLRQFIKTGSLLLGLSSSCYELFVVYITEVIATKVVRVHGGGFDA